MARSGVRNIEKLESLAEALGSLPEVLPEVLEDAAPQIAALIEQGFEAGVDPYGQKWTALAPATIAKGRKEPPLTDTHEMRDSLDVQPHGTTIAISIDSPFEYHQSGTDHVPARPMLPTGALPETWREALDNATQSAMARKFGGDL